MVPRQTYFPLILDKVQRHFSDYISTSNKNNELWLDYNGTPLKWFEIFQNNLTLSVQNDLLKNNF